MQKQPVDIVSLVKGLRSALQLSQQGFAELLGVSVRTVSRWETGGVKPDLELKNRLLRLDQIVKHRMTIDSTPESVMAWLTSPQLFQCLPMELLSSKRFVKIFHLD